MKIPFSENSSRQVKNLAAVSVAACLSLAFGIAVAAQDVRPSPPPPRPAGQSVVSGRVVFEDTGQPVPKARVQLVANRRSTPGVDVPASTFSVGITNDQGEFRFNGVAAGEYLLSAQVDPRPAAAQPNPGAGPSGVASPNQTRAGTATISVDGRTNTQVELRVSNPHFGIISGYVLRAGGDVAVNSRVTCATTTKADSAMSVLTDDKGAFRFEHVAAGDYLLSAGPPAPKAPEGEAVANQPAAFSFVQTYYPSTADPANAIPITVAADAETPGINITLIERTLHRVSGTLKFRSGEPIARVAVQLTPKTTNAGSNDPQVLAAWVPHLQFTDENGSWSFSNVPDGEYFLNVDARQRPQRNSGNGPTQPQPATPKFTARQQVVSVAGLDLTDVAIEVSAGGRISGSVVVEGDRPLPSNISIMAGAANTNEVRPASTTIQADHSFLLTGVPEGDVWILPQLRPANTFYVKAIDANGIDLTRSPLKVEDGADIKDVRIVISSGIAILTGRVLSANGSTPLSRTFVTLIPVDPEKQKFSGARFSSSSAADGSFTIGAAPGEYLVAAFRVGEKPGLDPESLANNKLRVTLRPGERKTLDIVK